MDKKVKVLLFGTGDGAIKALKMLDLNKVDILGFIDNDELKQKDNFFEKLVYKPSHIVNLEYDYILIASMYFKEIREQLISLKISGSKIVDLIQSPKKVKTSKEYVKELTIENSKYKNVLKEDYLDLFFKDYAVSDMFVFNKGRNLRLYDYPDHFVGGLDFVRVSTLELISREILENNIPGAVAELGVYKGDFSKLIHDLFPNKQLYLFDTFEGFHEKDIQLEKNYDLSTADVGGFGDTTIELVKNKLNRSDNIQIKKGYFPDTVEDMLDDKYCFVSIDVDLYKPTIDGLSYFYERLSKGGYILIHDYNHQKYSGVKKAVKEYCGKNNISLVPVSDYFGSVIITK